MSGDELDRLIEMAPDMEQPPVEDTVGQSPAAWSQGGGSEPFAEPSPQVARLLPLSMDQPLMDTPEARKRDQLEAVAETPPKMELVRRRISGKQADGKGLYVAKDPSPFQGFWRRVDEKLFMESLYRRQYEMFMYLLRKWVQTVKEEEVPEGMWVWCTSPTAETIPSSP